MAFIKKFKFGTAVQWRVDGGEWSHRGSVDDSVAMGEHIDDEFRYEVSNWLISRRTPLLGQYVGKDGFAGRENTFT